MATKTGIPVAPVAANKPPVTLSKAEILRYSRHLIMPEVGMDGAAQAQARPKVLCIGTGGLGAPLGPVSSRRWCQRDA